ncbi:MAG TPA: hypothetical protein PLG39_07855, partial [Methanotrichaceae archaeon]|nr:hypothetical protein [Methanotrichaceae archaeon]HQJ29243.1 hypothetical protein [Methanotrichaceae archaeon]
MPEQNTEIDDRCDTIRYPIPESEEKSRMPRTFARATVVAGLPSSARNSLIGDFWLEGIFKSVGHGVYMDHAISPDLMRGRSWYVRVLKWRWERNEERTSCSGSCC